MKVLILSLFIILSISCQDPAFTKIVISKKKESQNSQGQDAIGAKNKTFTSNKNNYVFGITTTRTKKQIANKVDLYILFDNSLSMYDNISKLLTSMKTFFAGVIKEKIPYNAHVLSMDLFLKQLKKVNGMDAYAPYKLFNGDTPDYNRGSYNNNYNVIDSFSGDNGYNVFKGIVNNIIEKNTNIELEPGIALGFDYFLWKSFNIKTSDETNQDKVHFIILSDEDNSSTYDIFDHVNYKVLSSHDLFMYQENSKVQHCTTTDVPNPEIRKDKLFTKTWCVTKQYKCPYEKTQTHYSCKAGDYTTTANKRGKYRCKIAQNFSCKLKYDNQDVWVSKSREEALNLIKSGVTCNIKNDSYSVNDTATNTGIGIKECNLYSCTSTTTSSTNYKYVPEKNKNDNCSSFADNKYPRTAFKLDFDDNNKITEISKLESCPDTYSFHTFDTESEMKTAHFNNNGNIFVRSLLDSITVPPEIRREPIAVPDMISKTTCDDPVVTKAYYKPTPQNFYALMKKFFPAKSFTWHSVVNIDGKSCKGLKEINVSEGVDYKKLSDITGGVIENICSDSYDGFAEKLFYKVYTELDISYKIPNFYLDKKIINVFNITKNKTLEAEKDYKIVDKKYIVFDKKVISENDRLNVEFEEK